jgi:hypothetical protein
MVWFGWVIIREYCGQTLGWPRSDESHIVPICCITTQTLSLISWREHHVQWKHGSSGTLRHGLTPRIFCGVHGLWKSSLMLWGKKLLSIEKGWPTYCTLPQTKDTGNRQEWNKKKNHCCHLSFNMWIPVKIYETGCFPLLLLKSGFGAGIFGIKSRQTGNARYAGQKLNSTKTETKWVSREGGGGGVE